MSGQIKVMSGQIKFGQTNLLYIINGNFMEFAKEWMSGQFSVLIISTANGQFITHDSHMATSTPLHHTAYPPLGHSLHPSWCSVLIWGRELRIRRYKLDRLSATPASKTHHNSKYQCSNEYIIMLQNNSPISWKYVKFHIQFAQCKKHKCNK